MTAVWSHSCDQDLKCLFSWSSVTSVLLQPQPSILSASAGPLVHVKVPVCICSTASFSTIKLASHICIPDPVSTSPSAPKQLPALTLLWCGLKNSPSSLLLPPPLLRWLFLHVTGQPSPMARPFKGSLSRDLTPRCQERSMGECQPSSPPPLLHASSLRTTEHLVV